MKKLLLASVAMLLASTAAALASNITIQVLLDGVLQAQTSDGENIVLPGFAAGPFNINNITATSYPTLPFPGVLSTQALDVQSAASAMGHVLDVLITAQNLPSATFGGLSSAFNTTFSQTALTNGWTNLVQSFIDPNNGLFTGSPLDNFTFTGAAAAFNGPGATFALPNTLFSATTEFRITSNGAAGQSNAGIQINSVPGPIVGAGLPGLISLAFGGWWWRRRKTEVVA